MALLAILNLHLSTAVAQTRRLGLITASYTMSASGSGYQSTSDAGGYDNSTDQVQYSSYGQSQYEVVQTETNLTIGNLVSSTFNEDVSWGGSELACSTWGIPVSHVWTYILGSSWEGTNGCYLGFDPSSSLTNMLEIVFENLASPGIVCLEEGATFNYVEEGSYGEGALLGAMPEAAFQYFIITNFQASWSQTLSTNVVYHQGQTFSNGSVAGDATLSLTYTLEYAPSQFSVPYTATPTNGTAALTVQFNADGLDSAKNEITTWNWDFGDGTITNAQSTSHQYTTNGTFSVTLNATNANGAPVQGIGPTNIFVARPTVKFTAFPTNGFIPLLVQFTSPDKDSGGNDITSRMWNFGDGNGSSDQSPANTYTWTNSKAFSPKLTVINELGMGIVATGAKILAIYPPVAFTASPTNGPLPLSVRFTAPSADLFGVALTKWIWDFGDGTTGQGQIASHNYTNYGIFSPSLIATNANKTPVAGIGPTISAGFGSIYTFFGTSGFNPNTLGTTNLDGMNPSAGLTVSGGRLYAVMSAGGSGGSGTILAVNADGSDLAVVHSFSQAASDPSNQAMTNGDGICPAGRLVLSGNVLYGAAQRGGSGGGGTVFKLNTDGSGFATLLDFPATVSNDPRPNGLMLSGDTLYGTAMNGGTNWNGAVFRLNTDGSGFSVIHTFSQASYDLSVQNVTNSDGINPAASLVSDGNSLYGTAKYGGVGGGGTVFKLNTDSSGFTTLHSFTSRDGQTPSSEPLLSGNTLYGTTSGGGDAGSGSVFKINTDGSGFATLHSFSATAFNPQNMGQTNSDGAQPSAGLVLSGGTLYGAASGGGPAGSGTLFAVDTNGDNFVNLYSFSLLPYGPPPPSPGSTNPDGANPSGTLALAGGVLYAATGNGGPQGDGAFLALSIAAAQSSFIGAWPTASPLTYGQALSASVLSGGVASVEGAFSFDAPTTVPRPGTYSASVTFTPADTADYQPVSGSVDVWVAPAPLTVTGLTANGKVYDGTTGETLSWNNVGLAGVISGDVVALETNGYTAAFASPSAGSNIAVTVTGLSLSGANAADYSLVQPLLAANISPAPLTITANSASKVYGQTVAFAGTEFTSSGLLNNDAVTSVNLASAGAPATAAVAGSPYTISPFGTVGTGLGNYTISYVSGTLTVKPAPLTVTANSATRLYGQTNPVFMGTITGIKNGDNITPVFACSASATSPPGSYAITVGLLDPNLRLANYTVTTNAGVLTIVGPTVSVARQRGSVSLTWPATVGLSYKVQFTTDLFQPAWTDLGAPTPATNSAATVIEAIEPGQARFYRAVIVP